MVVETCLNISQLPSPAKVGGTKPEFELPMLLLAAIRCEEWHEKGPGYLVLTDLTSNRNTSVAEGKLPSGIPLEYRLKDDLTNGLLDVDELFTVNVLYTKFPKVVTILQQSATHIIDKYDFRNRNKCIIAAEGIIVVVKFSLKVYDGCIEAQYSNLRVVDSRNARNIYPPTDPRLQELLNRFDVRSYSLLVNKLKENLGMDPTSLRRQIKKEKVLLQRIDRRPNVLGAALLFQQNVSDEGSSSEESLSYNSYSQIQPLQPAVPDVAATFLFTRAREHPPLPEQVRPPKRTHQPPLVTNPSQTTYSSNCTLLLLPPLPSTMLGLRRQLVFVVEVTVLGMFPIGPFVIKPFNRTLKVAPFKLIVSDNTKQIELEFNTPKEICELVECKEEEELYDLQFLALQKLNYMAATKKTFRISVGYMNHKTGFIRLYWTGKIVHKT